MLRPKIVRKAVIRAIRPAPKRKMVYWSNIRLLFDSKGFEIQRYQAGKG